MQAAFHQQLRTSFANQLNRSYGRRVAVRRFDDLHSFQIEPRLRGNILNALCRSYQDGLYEAFLTSFEGAAQRRFVAWVRYCGRYRIQTGTSLQQLVVFACSNFHTASATTTGTRAAGPVSFNARVSKIARPTPNKSG